MMFNRKRCENCCNMRRRSGMLVTENFICLHTMRYVGLHGTCEHFNKITDRVIKSLERQRGR